MKERIKARIPYCPSLSDEQSSFLKGASVMAVCLLMCKLHRILHKKPSGKVR